MNLGYILWIVVAVAVIMTGYPGPWFWVLMAIALVLLSKFQIRVIRVRR